MNTFSNAEWRLKIATKDAEPLAYQVTREAATEPPFSGRYYSFFEVGAYHCICCDALLFASADKFSSQCGWPSFSAAQEGATTQHTDRQLGMVRTEVRCTNCDAHLGHIFKDNYHNLDNPTRYCINSAALLFKA